VTPAFTLATHRINIDTALLIRLLLTFLLHLNLSVVWPAKHCNCIANQLSGLRPNVLAMSPLHVDFLMFNFLFLKALSEGIGTYTTLA